MIRFKVVSLALFLLTCFALSAQDTSQTTPGIETRRIIKGSPVVLSGDTLFQVYAPFGAFAAADRANAVSKRLQEIIREPHFYPDSLVSSLIDNDYYIFYRDQVIFVIGKKDEVATGLSKEDYSVQIMASLMDHLTVKSRRFNIWFMVKNIGYTLLVILVLIGIIKLLSWLFRKIYHYLDTHRDKIFKSIVLNNYEFLNAEREYTVAIYILKILKIGLIILFFLIALPVIFSIFPATEGITRKIIELVWGPIRNILMGVVNYIPEMITITVIYFVFRYLVRFVRFLSREIERQALVLPGFHPDWAKPTYNIIRIILYAFMFVVIFPYLPGSDSPVFRGVSVFLGVLISLGSTSLISNTMAGLVITYMRPYKIGDRIKIDDVVGDVVEKTLMITRIKTIKNEDVTIPNAKILTGYSVNYTTPTEKEGLIIHTTVTIGYDAPWRTVHELLKRAAHMTDGIIDDPKPFVLQTSLDDFYISYQINGYIRESHRILQIRSDLHQNIQDEFNRSGIEIMSPHYRSERDGNKVTIPDEIEVKLPPEREKTVGL